jgi:hypothetical protein
MRQDQRLLRKLNLDKKTVARLGNPAMNRLFGGRQGDPDPVNAASTRPQCDSVKPLTGVITTVPLTVTITH